MRRNNLERTITEQLGTIVRDGPPGCFVRMTSTSRLGLHQPCSSSSALCGLSPASSSCSDTSKRGSIGDSLQEQDTTQPDPSAVYYQVNSSSFGGGPAPTEEDEWTPATTEDEFSQHDDDDIDDDDEVVVVMIEPPSFTPSNSGKKRRKKSPSAPSPNAGENTAAVDITCEPGLYRLLNVCCNGNVDQVEVFCRSAEQLHSARQRLQRETLLEVNTKVAQAEVDFWSSVIPVVTSPEFHVMMRAAQGLDDL